jgi:hypothetical protein
VARASQGDRCTGEHVNPTVVTKPDRRKRVPRVMAIANSRRGSRPENSCGMLCADRSRATPRANLARPEKACARNSASSTRDPNSDMAERQTSGPFQGNGAVTVRTRARTLFSLSTIADLCARERIGPTTKAPASASTSPHCDRSWRRLSQNKPSLKRLLAGRRACRRWTKAILAAFAKANAGVAQPARSPSSGSSSVAARSTP